MSKEKGECVGLNDKCANSANVYVELLFTYELWWTSLCVCVFGCQTTPVRPTHTRRSVAKRAQMITTTSGLNRPDLIELTNLMNLLNKQCNVYSNGNTLSFSYIWWDSRLALNAFLFVSVAKKWMSTGHFEKGVCVCVWMQIKIFYFLASVFLWIKLVGDQNKTKESKIQKWRNWFLVITRKTSKLKSGDISD